MSEREQQMTPQEKFSPSEQHRRQMFWQVWVPLIASLVIVLTLAILSIFGAVVGSSQVERWGNLSAAWVIAPLLFVGIIFMAIAFGCVYGMSKLLGHMPEWMLKAQLFFVRIALIIRRAADTTTLPVMKVHGYQASTHYLWNRYFGKTARSDHKKDGVK
jgi:sterol desaturase/sphingolipid hydroxylase (fatty acid hydroxylase superfamily)